MSQWLLALNVGSSSVKFAAYPRATGPDMLRGHVFNIDRQPHLKLRRPGAPEIISPAPGVSDLASAIDHALDIAFSHLQLASLAAVGHRIVHGGATFTGPVLLGAETIEALEKLAPLAPLHQPANLAAIELVASRSPGVAQVGCFDTAFHAQQPRIDAVFALPIELTQRGVRRFGFHGLSYEHAAGVLLERHGGGGRAVVAHLGAGASLCALQNGVSIATTMGMTPLGGVPMATRSGDLDPGAVLYLQEQLGMTNSEVRDLLYRQSGLLGLSGESGDMQTLLASTRPRARDAVTFFVECVQREIASLAGALGGVDTLVFTGGIGEHAPLIRARIAAACAWMGVYLDPTLNEANAAEIHAPASAVRIAIIPANEEQVIAAHVRALLGA